MELIYLLAGLVFGAIAAALIVYNRFLSSGAYIATTVLNEKYVLKDILTDIQNQLNNLKKEFNDKSLTIIELNKDLASQEQINAHLDEKLLTQKEELIHLQQRFQTEFENIANRLLEEKSQRFTLQNQVQLNDILNPLINLKIKVNL